MNIYLIALIVGGGLLLLSLLGGGDTDFDGDFGGDVGDIGDAGDAADFSHADVGAETPVGDLASWFSMRAVVSFVAFFGLAGMLGQWLGLGSTETLLTALASGAAAGFITAYVFRLARARGNVSFEAATMTGRVGKVLIAVGPGKLGRVQLEVGGGLEQLTARSPEALGAGTQIIVTGEHEGVLEVQRWGEGALEL